MAGHPGFPSIIFDLCGAEDVPIHARQAAAVLLKNHIKVTGHWTQLADPDRDHIRNHIIEALIASPKLVR